MAIDVMRIIITELEKDKTKWYSARELMMTLRKEMFFTNENTVLKNVKELMTVNMRIAMRYERRGKTRVTTQTFKIIE